MTDSLGLQVDRFLQSCQSRVERYLDFYLPSADTVPQKLHQAMRYMVQSGGKRLRPLLVYATGVSLAAPLDYLDPPAAAIELIHTYSLVHDDLPAMDNAELRRGQASCHKAFDEATAILVGDALQTLAFEIISSQTVMQNPICQLDMIKMLASASGPAGMVAGQALDIEPNTKQLSVNELETISRLKTGGLIRASVRLGAMAAGASDTMLVILDHFASAIGLAFQIQDDILDVEGSAEKLGKKPGSDASLNKATYPNLLGIEKAKAKVHTLQQQALQALSQLDLDTTLLSTLCKQLIEREA